MKPKLAVLYGQAPELSTSFQTRELARHLVPWFDVDHFELPRNLRGIRGQAARLWHSWFSKALRCAPGDFLLYGNDGFADLRKSRAQTILYWYDAPQDWAATPPATLKDRIRCANVIAAKHVFAVSAAQVRVGEALRGSPVHYLPVGVDCDFFDPTKLDRSAARARFGFEPDQIVIGYLGYLGRWGNRFAGEALLEAVPRLNLPKTRYLIVGNGPALGAWKERAERLGLASRFTFTGFLPTQDLPVALVSMDLCIDTLEPGFHSEARSETKLKQYMAMGRACVATDIGENRVDLASGKAGLLAPPHPEGLARCIADLAENREARERLGAAARQRAQSAYHWPILASTMAQIVAKVSD